MDAEIDLNQFYKIYAGISWPGIRPGFVVILGRERGRAPGHDAPMIHVLDEMESPDIWTLLEAAARFDNFYQPDKCLLSSLENQAGMILLKDMNDHLQTRQPMESRQRRITAQAAPFSELKDAFNVWANCIKRNLEAGRKLLQFFQGSALPAYLLQLKNEETFRALPTDYPAISALGMTLLSITSYRPVDPKRFDQYRQADIGEVFF